MFDRYCAWTGQSINRNKSCILFSQATPLWRARRIANLLGVPRVDEFTYLGVKLKLKALTSSDFQDIIRRVQTRLSGWGVRSLSFAGRILLINAVLLMLPVYLLSHCLVPLNVIERIEKAARTFLWCGREGSGLHYVAWSEVCKPKGAGGLGIHSLKKWRAALLAKHAFRFVSNEPSLLNTCLHEKYGSALAIQRFRRADSPTWRLLGIGFATLQPFLCWEIANGLQTRVWEDHWIFGRNLLGWPTHIADDHELPGLVAELVNSEGNWHVDRLLQLFGPHLAAVIERIQIFANRQRDTPMLCQQFSGNSISSFLYKQSFQECCFEFAWLWKLRIRPREKVFFWRVCLDAIPTYTWLARRGLHGDNNCPWGCPDAETVEHICTRCGFFTEAIDALSKWGFIVPVYTSLNDVLRWLQREALRKVPSAESILFCYLFYQLWRCRNAKTHGREHGTPAVAAANALGNISVGKQHPLRHWGTSAPPGTVTPTSWCPPPRGWLKANFDGSLTADGTAGGAVVIRDACGSFIVAKGVQLTHWDPGAVELQALMILRDLIAHIPTCSGLVIEGDSFNVIQHIQTAYVNSSRGGRSRDTQDLLFLSHFSHVVFIYVERNCNQLADLLANLARDGEFCWLDVMVTPPEVCALLNQERRFVPA